MAPTTTTQAALEWINMLLEKSPSDMGRFIQELLPTLLNALKDDADDVVLMNLQARGDPMNRFGGAEDLKANPRCTLGVEGRQPWGVKEKGKGRIRTRSKKKNRGECKPGRSQLTFSLSRFAEA